MNGITFALSKSCCPMYNFGTSNTMYKIPRRLSNFHLPKIYSPVATTRMLIKPRVYCKNITNLRSAVRRDGLPVMIGFCIISIILSKAWEVVARFISPTGLVGGVLKSNACKSILIGIATFFIASRVIDSNIMRVARLFLPGDLIEVEHVKGQVTKIGPITTYLVTAESRHIQIPTSWFLDKAPWHFMVSTIYLEYEDDDENKMMEIINELKKMIRSLSNVYLKEEKKLPRVVLTEGETYRELTLACYLKRVSEVEFNVAKRHVLLKALEIIKKHGAKIADHLGEVKKSL